MALYKYAQNLRTSDHSAFDTKQPPGSVAVYPGIYRCIECGDEIGIAKGHTLPPQNHHQHAQGKGKIEWQLMVFAQSKD